MKLKNEEGGDRREKFHRPVLAGGFFFARAKAKAKQSQEINQNKKITPLANQLLAPIITTLIGY